MSICKSKCETTELPFVIVCHANLHKFRFIQSKSPGYIYSQGFDTPDYKADMTKSVPNQDCTSYESLFLYEHKDLKKNINIAYHLLHVY